LNNHCGALSNLKEASSSESGAAVKKWIKRIPMVFGIFGCVLATAWGGSPADPEVGAAIQAIEQAPDPSAAVAAYVNGASVDRNDPKLSERPTSPAWSI